MPTSKTMPPQQYLNECFEYCSNGTLVWKARPLAHFGSLQSYEKFLTTFVGKIAGTIDDRYVKINLTWAGKKVRLYAHRVIWVMHNGPIPEGFEIDHEDTDKLNNCVLNLRLATSTNNNSNRGIASNNTSGVKGVSLDKGQWLARVTVNQKRTRVGHFSNLEEASVAVKLARETLHQQFANHGM